MMESLARQTILTAAAWWGYTYAGYPALLAALARRERKKPVELLDEWPSISICVPAHNEAASIATTLTRILQLDYPADKRQIVVISDASDDGTDSIVESFADYGVDLVRIGRRLGKTEGENVVAPRLTGSIIVNTDASVVVDRAALKRLVAEFADPAVGLASGRDVSVARDALASAESTRGESTYVGYEMMIRELETRVSGLVGASGCLYAVRAPIQRVQLPGGLSRDFAAALIARERGWRAVTVRDAVCYVPRSGSLRREYRRKARTITRGLATLVHHRHLLNPFRYGAFSWMLASHKLMRWLAPWFAVAAVAAFAVLAQNHVWARVVCGAIALGGAAAIIGYARSEKHDRSVFGRMCSLAAFAVASNAAVLDAWARLIRGFNPPVWEPTRRTTGAPVLRS